MSELSPGDFAYVAELVRREAAIVLEPGKEYLVESRLSPLLRGAGAANVTEFVRTLRADPSGPLLRRVVDAMTTNETSFFRDTVPFDALKNEILPPLADKAGPIRIWSAAGSSGQEAYSIAMTIADVLPERLRPERLQILATDISESMLERIDNGIYSQLEVNRGLPARQLVRWFTRVGTTWQVSQTLRTVVESKSLNLAGAWPILGQFDIVMLRNVLIYFDDETKRQVLRGVQRVLAPGAHLFLGAGEDATMIDPVWQRVQVGTGRCFRLTADVPRVNVPRQAASSSAAVSR
jgi:chemotaxis protein methyltransferase CheR